MPTPTTSTNTVDQQPGGREKAPLSRPSLKDLSNPTRVAIHGLAGAGKTTLAAMLVSDPEIRKAFTRICWVTLGQTPDLCLLQQALFRQLTSGKVLPDALTEPHAILEALRSAAQGQRVLVVLDDFWGG